MSQLAATVIYLADAEGAGRAVVRLMVPLAGVILVILGVIYLIRGSRAKKRTPVYPPAPPGYYYPPPGYYPPPPGYYPPPPIPPKSTHGRTGAILLVVGILLMGAAVVSTVGRVTKEAKSAIDVGQCTDIVAADTPNDLVAMDCSDPAAVDELATRSETNECPDGEPVGSGKSMYGSMSNGSTAYCFIPNLKQGHCYTVDTASGVFTPVDCSADLAVLVAKRVDGNVDEALCGADTKPITYPEPPRTYCARKP